MSKLLKPFKVIREHWKKSIFFSGLAAYGAHWVNETRKEEAIRTEYCEKAKLYGDVAIASAFKKPDSVLVLINRSAANNKAKTQFEKNCSPILNLAGLDVEVSDWEGSYSDESTEALNKFLKNSQKSYAAVLIVGGNRTVNAYLNYAMSQASPAKSLPPTAFVPVGKDSVVMTRFLPFVGSTAYVQRLCETAFKVVQGQPETVDVLRIETQEADENSAPHFLFGISTFAFDKVTDLSHKSFKYWYLPGVTKRIFVGIGGLFMGSFTERIFGDIEAVYNERPPVLPQTATSNPVQKSGGWFGWGRGSPKNPVAASTEPQRGSLAPLTNVRTGPFDADFISISANLPNKLGSFLVEVSTEKIGSFTAFGHAVLKQFPKVEDSFRATDLTLNLKLVPRQASFYIDGVPHSDFDRVVKVSIVPKAFRMFY